MAIGSRSSGRCVLEAELVAELAGAVLQVGVLEPLAPHDAAGEGRVFLVPFGDQLLQVARPHQPHVQWSVRLKQVEQPPKADPLRHRQLAWLSGREVAHD